MILIYPNAGLSGVLLKRNYFFNYKCAIEMHFLISCFLLMKIEETERKVASLISMTTTEQSPHRISRFYQLSITVPGLKFPS